MRRDRSIRSRRRGLNPNKIIFVYFLAFGLVSFHQAGRLADWFDNLALRHQGYISEKAFNVSSFLRGNIDPYGPRQFNKIEDLVLNFFTPAHQVEIAQNSPNTESKPLTKSENYENFSQTEKAAQGLILKSHFTKENNQQEDPYADLPPIYLTQKPDAEKAPVSSLSEQTAYLGGKIILPQISPKALGKRINPSRTLLIGDSMMLDGIGPPLQRALKQNEGLAVFRDGQYGTGLARLDNFDWLSYFEERLNKYKPDLVIITIGANDAQDMVGSGKRVHFASDKWNENYKERVSELLNIANKKGIEVFWVGLPIMGDIKFSEKIESVNQLAKTSCEAASNCYFWDSWNILTDSKGRYATYLRGTDGKSIRVRRGDDIHLSEAGGRIVADKFLADIETWVDFKVKELEEKKEKKEQGAAATVTMKLPSKSSDVETINSLSSRDTSESKTLGLRKAPSGHSAEKAIAPSAGEADEDGELNVQQLKSSGKVMAVQGIEKHKIYSKARGANINYYLAKPLLSNNKQALAGQKYPLLLLLHGAWDGYSAWVDNIGHKEMAALAQRFGLIIAMPDCEAFGWYIDGKETAIESFLINEFLPHVLAQEDASDKSKIAVAGLSMGGHGALTLTLKYPTLFKATGAMSAISDISHHTKGKHAVNVKLLIEKALGPPGENGINWRPYSAHWMSVEKKDFWQGRPLVLSVGKNDTLTLAENQAFSKLLVKYKKNKADINSLSCPDANESEILSLRNAPSGCGHVYREVEGGHNWQFWRTELPFILEFISHFFSSSIPDV